MERHAAVQLPRTADLTPLALGFLQTHFNTQEDLLTAADLASELDRRHTQYETDLQSLHRTLGSSIVSWSSRSIHAKSSAADLTLQLENLSLQSSQYGNRSFGARKIEKILKDELPFTVSELNRINTIREYAESALKLEALVGDLEDAVFRALNRQTRNDSSAKHANILKAVEAINIVEDQLFNIAKFNPQWHHILKTVDARIDKILTVLRPHVIADHRGVLATLGWPPKVLTSRIEGGLASSIPNPLVLMQRDKRESYSQSFLALCMLQHAQKRREDRSCALLGKKDSFVGLWAVDELVSPIASRIEYHSIKWIDQPELICALVYKITRDFIEGVDDVLQPLIDEARLVSCSAKEAWVSSMLQVLSGFIVKRIFPGLVSKYKEKHSKEEAASSWLRLMDNIILFDKRVQSLQWLETSLFLGESNTFIEPSSSLSVLSLFHDKLDWLRTWAKVEVKDAWKKLKAELKQESAWSTYKNQNQSDHTERYLLTTREDFKAPPIADFALKIAWIMIERCQTMPLMSARVQFIRSGAVKFLWHFFNVLLLRFQRTEFSAYDSEEALERVCQLVNIAKFCEYKLQDWSDDVNFLELRISESEAHVRSKIAENGCFFDDEIRSLSELQTNWLSEIVAQVLRQYESCTFEYYKDVQGFNQGMDSTAMNVSSNLGEALDNLRGQLLLIKKHLNPKDFLDLWRSIADGLDLFVFRSITSNNDRFSQKGAQQLEADVDGLFLVFRTLCARPEAFFPYIRDLSSTLKMCREDVRHFETFAAAASDAEKC